MGAFDNSVSAYATPDMFFAGAGNGNPLAQVGAQQFGPWFGSMFGGMGGMGSSGLPSWLYGMNSGNMGLSGGIGSGQVQSMLAQLGNLAAPTGASQGASQIASPFGNGTAAGTAVPQFGAGNPLMSQSGSQPPQWGQMGTGQAGGGQALSPPNFGFNPSTLPWNSVMLPGGR